MSTSNHNRQFPADDALVNWILIAIVPRLQLRHKLNYFSTLSKISKKKNSSLFVEIFKNTFKLPTSFKPETCLNQGLA
jgi:hypothetical protein